MKKSLNLGICILISIILLVGCGRTTNNKNQGDNNSNNGASSKEEKVDINIASLKGPTTMGMVKLMEDSEKGLTENNYAVSMTGTADEIVTKLVKGEIDIAAIPCNLASVIYNKTKGEISIAAVNTLGVLYVVENGNDINSIEDLKGKTIYTTGKGTTPEYVLNYILKGNNLEPNKDVTIEYKSESTEIATLLSEDSDAIAMIPQPFVTIAQSKNNNLRIALDMTKEWEELQGQEGSSLVTGVVVARNEFIKNNKEAFDKYLEDYKISTEYVNSNVEDASTLIEKYDIAPAMVAKKAVPLCNITYIDGDEMKVKVSGYLKALFEANPQSIGGTVPMDDFYYKK